MLSFESCSSSSSPLFLVPRAIALFQYNGILRSYFEALFDPNPKRSAQWVWLKKRVGTWLPSGFFFCLQLYAGAGWTEWQCRKAMRAWPKNNRMVWVGSECEDPPVPTLLPAMGRETFQVAQHLVQHELEHFQEWGRNLLALSSTLWPCGNCLLMKDSHPLSVKDLLWSKETSPLAVLWPKATSEWIPAQLLAMKLQGCSNEVSRAWWTLEFLKHLVCIWVTATTLMKRLMLNQIKKCQYKAHGEWGSHFGPRNI